MKKVFALLCCCALLTQSAVAQEKSSDNKGQKRQDTKQNQYAKQDMKKQDGTTAAMQQYVGCSKIVGQYIYGSDGETVGDFNSITLDKDGNVLHAIVGVGGVAGVGETEIAVPWAAFNCECTMQDGEKSCKATLPMTEEQLKKAPALEKSEYAELYDQAWLQTNAKFYGVETAASAPSKGSMMCVTDLSGLQLSGAKAMETASSDKNQKTQTSSKANDEVDLGTIEEVVIDLGDQKACYVILGDDSGLLSEKHVAIPFSQVKFAKKDDELCANVAATPKDIEAAPKVTPGEYQELDKDSVRKQVDESFTGR